MQGQVQTYVYLYSSTQHVQKQTCNYTHMFSSSLQVAAWTQVMKYSFCCSDFFGDETLEDSTECVRGSHSFSFSASFFSTKPVLLTAFLQPSAHSISLSASFLSPFLLFLSLSLSLGTVWFVRPVIELPLFDQGSNRNCTLLTRLCRPVCLCMYVSIYYRRMHVIVCGYVYNVWLSAACVCLITAFLCSEVLFEV